ncbi:MAG: hypothetical protein ACOY3U_10565 [Bacillota bacterium]
MGVIPFEPERKFAAKYFRKEFRVRVVVKGALEVVLPRCKTMWSENGVVDVDAKKLQEEAHLLAAACIIAIVMEIFKWVTKPSVTKPDL